ncbi:macro domain-containing protein [Sulfurimonas sp. HSL-1716]|uniref:macro domain-containing protein n=1 Tax=Hydrocurvibacter sulfurireducens TaxID=3131937 RepID=UPI0031F9FEAE
MIKLKIKYGNLINEKSTFIVNASNTELILGSGVSKSFREKCGGSFYQQYLYEIKQKYIDIFGTIEQGDVIISNAGSAKNFKYALHVAVMNYTDDTKVPFPTYSQIKRSLKTILSLIEKKVISEKLTNPTLTIPLLGTGTGGLKKEKIFFMIKNMFQNSDLNLTLIIYIHDKKDFLKFFYKNLKKEFSS